MKGFTLLIQFGWCGFGISAGLVPEIRLGVLRIAACRGWIMDALDRYRAVMMRATRVMRGEA